MSDVVSSAINLSHDLFKGLNDQEESVDNIINCIKDDLYEIVKTERGQRLIENVGKLATKVGTYEAFQATIKRLFQLAKEVNPARALALFLLLIAALGVYMYLVPESMVAVWVNMVIQHLGVGLANSFNRLKDFTMAVAEFFKSFPLSVATAPSTSLLQVDRSSKKIGMMSSVRMTTRSVTFHYRSGNATPLRGNDISLFIINYLAISVSVL